MMGKIVRVEDGIVVEMFETMPVFHESLMAQVREDAPIDAGFGWRFDGMHYTPPPPPPLPEKEDYLRAIRNVLDGKAQERDYDGIVSACSYVGSSVASYRLEAAALAAWRDEVWLHGYAQLAAIEGGQRPAPAMTEFLASLPTFSWPN